MLSHIADICIVFVVFSLLCCLFAYLIHLVIQFAKKAAHCYDENHVCHHCKMVFIGGNTFEYEFCPYCGNTLTPFGEKDNAL